MIETDEDRNEKKINIGMNLKSNKRNEEVLINSIVNLSVKVLKLYIVFFI